MWSNDDDFTKDIDTIGEIWEKNQIHNNENRIIASIPKLSGKNERLRLYSESDDEEVNDIENFEDENNPLHVMNEIERQIAEVTGNVHDNKILTDYWRTTLDIKNSSNTNKTEYVEVASKHSNLVFPSDLNEHVIKLINNEVTSKPKNKVLKPSKKCSIAEAISLSIAKIQEPVTHQKITPPLPNFIFPRNEIVTKASEPNCRFSLRINEGCHLVNNESYKVPDYQADNLSNKSTCHSNTSESSSLSRTSLRSRDECSEKLYFSPTKAEKDFINIHSEKEFPPL